MEDYVELIGELTVQVIARSPANIKVIEGLNGKAIGGKPNTWRIDHDNEDHLARILQTLRDAGIAFGGGHGWPPAAIAAMLRNKGKFHGTIRAMWWSGPNQYVVRDQ